MPNQASEIRNTLHAIGARNLQRRALTGDNAAVRDIDALIVMVEPLITFAERTANRQVRHHVAAARAALGLDHRTGAPAGNIWQEVLNEWPNGVRFTFQAEDSETVALIVAALTELNPEAPLPAALANMLALDRQHVATLAEHVADTDAGASGGIVAAAGVTLTTVAGGQG